MDLEKIAPIIKKIIQDVLLEKKYPYGRVKMGVNNKKASGDLIDYISVRPVNQAHLKMLEIYMLDYAQVVDQGRAKGTAVSPLAIMKWLQSRGINVRDEKGRLVEGQQKFRKSLQNSINQNQALPIAFKISNSIKANSIRATYFMEDALERIKNNAKIDELLGEEAIQDLLDSIK